MLIKIMKIAIDFVMGYQFPNTIDIYIWEPCMQNVKENMMDLTMNHNQHVNSMDSLL